MSKIKNNIFVGFIAISSIIYPLTVMSANAQYLPLSQLRGEGFRACEALGNSGFTGVVRGKTSSISVRGKDAPFSIRYCFEARSQCETFINRIGHVVRGVNTISYARCTTR